MLPLKLLLYLRHTTLMQTPMSSLGNSKFQSIELFSRSLLFSIVANLRVIAGLHDRSDLSGAQSTDVSSYTMVDPSKFIFTHFNIYYYYITSITSLFLHKKVPERIFMCYLFNTSTLLGPPL